MFTLGQTYIRRDLQKIYGGQARGGISTPTKYPIVLLFTGEQGSQYGYHDGWTQDGIFLYTGEGQVGDMMLVRGNRAIFEHTAKGKDLHLFEYVKKGIVRYINQMIYTGFQEHVATDKKGALRKTIVFELVPIDAFSVRIGEYESTTQPLLVLRDRALASSANAREPVERKQAVRYRSDAIHDYVLKRSEGICEGCGNYAPFVTAKGMPYL